MVKLLELSVMSNSLLQHTTIDLGHTIMMRTSLQRRLRKKKQKKEDEQKPGSVKEEGMVNVRCCIKSGSWGHKDSLL